MKKTIFIDFDGTLMESKRGIIPDSSIEAITLLQKKGHTVFIATGRNVALLEDYPNRLNIDNIIGSNGRFIKIKDNNIYENPIPLSIVKPLLEDLVSLKIDYTLSTDNEYFSHQQFSSLIHSFSEHFKMPKAKIEPNNNDLNHIFQINIFTEDELPLEIKKKYPLTFTRASKHAYDVTLGNQLKEEGLKFLEKYLNQSKKDFVAIGDGLNDIGMIEYAGVGIAMGNAKIELKNVADYVTDSIENDGLFKAFKHFNLI